MKNLFNVAWHSFLSHIYIRLFLNGLGKGITIGKQINRKERLTKCAECSIKGALRVFGQPRLEGSRPMALMGLRPFLLPLLKGESVNWKILLGSAIFFYAFSIINIGNNYIVHAYLIAGHLMWFAGMAIKFKK